MRQGEPKPDAPVGRPPDWLGKDARRVWRTIARRLTGLGLLTQVDRDVFARYCAMLAEWRRLHGAMKDASPVYALRNEDGSIRYIQERPEVSLMLRLAKQLLALEREFGFTPAARAGLKTEGGRQEADQVGEAPKLRIV